MDAVKDLKATKGMRNLAFWRPVPFATTVHDKPFRCRVIASKSPAAALMFIFTFG
jgi:hypothetical protein